MDWLRAAQTLRCVLDLPREVVAVDLAQTSAEFASWSVRALKGKLSFCAMVRLASLGRGRKALGANFGCRGASEVFRFVEPTPEALSGERLHGFGLYASQEIAQQMQASMARLPEPCMGVAVMPLAACNRPPQVVVVLANAYQAMRLVQAWAYHHGPVRNAFLAGNRGICAECVAKPLVSDMLNLSPLCANTRHTAKWADQELGLGLPFAHLEQLLDGLLKTVNAAESEERKQALVERCAAAGVELKLPRGTSYFSQR